MDLVEKRLLECGISVPEILVPKATDSIRSWASSSYDQSSLKTDDQPPSKPRSAVSSSEVMLPDDFMTCINIEHTENAIVKNMKRLLKSGHFNSYKGFILTKHIYSSGVIRFGLLTCLDLEEYGCEGRSNLIASAKIPDDAVSALLCEFRKKALTETPYSTVLINDPKFGIVEPLASSCSLLRRLYSFNRPVFGQYEGYHIYTPQHFTLTNNALFKIQKKSIEDNVALYLVAEGNDQFMAAKKHWESLKEKYGKDLATYHPARFFMVEIFNIDDPNMELIPYDVILRNVNITEFMAAIRKDHKIKAETVQGDMRDALSKRFYKYNALCFGLISAEQSFLVTFKDPGCDIGTVFLDGFLKDYMKEHPADIRHTLDMTEFNNDSAINTNLGIMMPPINKATFFKDISVLGPLHKYSYALDTLQNQRFCFESRKITD
ncbi:MAG: DUF1015 family protein [Clostridia bacterium]|jgi:hypothetical protein